MNAPKQLRPGGEWPSCETYYVNDDVSCQVEFSGFDQTSTKHPYCRYVMFRRKEKGPNNLGPFHESSFDLRSA